MDLSAATKVLLEIRRRQELGQRIDSHVFDKQLAFIEDKSRLKAALTTRRSGKSMGAGFYLMRMALAHPNRKTYFITRTRGMAENIMAMHVFTPIHKELGVPEDFNRVKLLYTLPNGSTIQLVGIDSGPAEMDKILGIKGDLFVIDEAAFIQQDLERLVYQVLKPATSDTRGTIALISTPSDKTHGLFFEVTTGRRADWSVHAWSAVDNPHMRQQFQEDIDAEIAFNPQVIHTPYFKQMYLGQWVINTDALVYNFDRDRDLIRCLPKTAKGAALQVGLGIDLGYNDACAFTIMVFVPGDPTLYIVHTEKHTGLDVTDTAMKAAELRDRFSPTKMIVDGASKQVVEELKRRHAMPLVIAEKTDKKGWIDLFNADAKRGKIKLIEGETKELQFEYLNLIWHPEKQRAGIFEELASCKNDLCDATLYLYRYFRPMVMTTELHLRRGSQAELDHQLQLQLDARETENYEENLYAEYL